MLVAVALIALVHTATVGATDCNAADPNINTGTCTEPVKGLEAGCPAQASNAYDSKPQNFTVNVTLPDVGVSYHERRIGSRTMLCRKVGSRRETITAMVQAAGETAFTPVGTPVVVNDITAKTIKKTLNVPIDCAAPGFSGAMLKIQVINRWVPKRGYKNRYKPHRADKTAFDSTPQTICS